MRAAAGAQLKRTQDYGHGYEQPCLVRGRGYWRPWHVVLLSLLSNPPQNIYPRRTQKNGPEDHGKARATMIAKGEMRSRKKYFFVIYPLTSLFLIYS